MSDIRPFKSPAAAKIDDTLARSVREYRKRTRMTQGLLAEFTGLSFTAIQHLEHNEPTTPETQARMREYLASAPTTRPLRAVRNRPRNIYLTQKLLTWATITNQPADSVEAVRALKDAYDRAKVEQGLASIPLVQLEVENALTLATRGHYRRSMRDPQ